MQLEGLGTTSPRGRVRRPACGQLTPDSSARLSGSSSTWCWVDNRTAVDVIDECGPVAVVEAEPLVIRAKALALDLDDLH